MRLAAALLLVMASTLASPQTRAQDLASYVDPFIGTAPSPLSNYGPEFDGGDTFPGAVYPVGMLAWSPDTLGHRIPGGYAYQDRTLKGFSLTHFSGRGCTVYQDVPILPGANGSFSHANESASPGSYSVTLDNGIGVELTVTQRTGFGRFAFPDGVPATISIDSGGSVNGVFASHVDASSDRQLLSGSVESQVGCGTDHYTLYFAIAFDAPFASINTEGSMTTLSFDTSVVQLKPAISYVSVDNALANLAAENPDWDFASVRAQARAAWNDVLGRLEVQGGSDADLRSFYTALYHVFLEPNVFSDANGQYLGFDDRTYQVASGHAHYANIAGWDQYRSLIQLRAMLAPDQASDIIQSLVDDAVQGGGGMPRWEQANRNSAGMVGDSPPALVASAYAFGARDFDATAALDALDRGASLPGTLSGGHPVREYLQPWLDQGYIPRQPSISLEYATDDFALAQFARALGREDLYERYTSRAANWRKVLGMDGDFVEGSAEQYTWMVPFDYPGLASALGGTSVALARLDEFFSEVNAGPQRPYVWIGNEPSLAAPWAYAVLGAPARTQSTVRRIQHDAFSDGPGGLPGNDDGGTLSAWYVFAAVGFYPLVPGVAGVVLGSPQFPSVDVHLENGQTIHITTDAPDAPVSPWLNSTPVSGAWLDWSQIANGATLDFHEQP